MGRRSANLDAFRPDRHAVAATAPNRRQTLALVVVLVVVAAAIAVASYLVKPSKARSFQLFYGSLFLNDERAPVAIDLTNGKPTVRLVDANQQVSATNPTDLTVVPVTGGTLLLDRSTGEFNLVDETGFVVKNKGGGVPLPTASGPRETFAVAADDNAYLVQTGTTGTSVYLVGKPTVQAAAAGGPVRPRASATMTQPVQTTAGGAVSADGDLWVLAGSGSARVVRQLHVPAGTDAGATLASTDHGNVSAIAALAAGSQNTDGTGGEVVGVASPTAVEVFDASGTAHSSPVSGLSGVDQILPANNNTGRLSFLYHSTAGWAVVSVGADGTGLEGPHAISTIPAATQLTAPAASNGKLYTLDTGSTGRLYAVAPDGSGSGVGDQTAYPVVTANGRAVEAATFSDAYTVARGDRVIFDSPHHVRALAVFTDGTREPLVIDKSAAADLNSAGTALALDTENKGTQQQQQQTKPQPQPQQQVNNAIACKTTKQVPHIPTITRAMPGSRSVELHWSYPLLDPQDCVPSTYQVKIKLLSANAPSAPGSVTVQGQDAVTIAGLFPSTRYELTVTAFLNGTGTASSPVQVTTGPEGPAAPTNVKTVFGNGKWTVSWNSCGGVSSGCVPTTSWNVVAHLCDNQGGFASPPPSQSVPGDPSSHSFSASFTADSGILGRAVSFNVEGVGLQGTIGDPKGDGGCTYSYGNVLTDSIHLSASQPPVVHGNGTTSTDATVHFDGSATVDVGGSGAVSLTLVNGAQAPQGAPRILQVTGQNDLHTTFDNLQAGTQYFINWKILPAHNPRTSVAMPQYKVEAATAVFPTIAVDAASFNNDDNLHGTLSFTITGVNPPPGVSVDMTGSSLDCGGGNSSLPISRVQIPTGDPIVIHDIDRSKYFGNCNIIVQLQQHDPGSTPYYSGPSNRVNKPISIPPPTVTGGSNGWNATWNHGTGHGGQGSIHISYTGHDPLVRLAGEYDIKVVDPDSLGNCGVQKISGEPSGDVTVTPPCMKETDAATGTWSVAIHYAVFGQQANFTVQVTGKFPS